MAITIKIIGNEAIKDLLLQHNKLGAVIATSHKNLTEYQNSARKEGEITIIDLDNIEAGITQDAIIYLSSKQAETPNSLKKPFHLNELFNKISALAGSRKETSIGNFKFNHSKKILSLNGKNIDLTEKEAAIINYISAAAPNSVDKKELLGEVWGYDENIDTHTLETHIYRLRKKIGDDEFIINDGNGYRIKT